MKQLYRQWHWRQEQPQSRSYCHALLLHDRVVGPWFCLDRGTGSVIWHRTDEPLNNLWRVVDSVVVATEYQAHGPVTGRSGLQALDLETGETLWRLPPETSDGEAPTKVRDQKIVTSSRRILDPRTGEVVGMLPPGEPYEKMAPIGRDLYHVGGYPVDGAGTVYLGTGEDYFEAKQSAAEFSDEPPYFMPLNMGRGEPFGFTMEGPTGEILWTFDLPVSKAYVDGNYYSYRELGSSIVFIYAQPTTDPTEWSPDEPETEPAPWFLAVLDLRTGLVASTFELGTSAGEAQIEALDPQGVLVSMDTPDARKFSYFTVLNGESAS
ncbi:MAG: hypothetical protein AAGM22_25370 [Acidobacteriota bacterium]